MSGYLDSYGVSDAKRARNWARIVGGTVAAVLLALLGYWYLHSFQEKRVASRFFDALEQKNYDEAYRLWGCDPANPCRDYNKQAFLADWGPNGLYGNISSMEIRRTRSCSSTVLFVLRFPGGKRTSLFVNRADKTLSFGPPTPVDTLIEYCVDPLGRYENMGDKFYHVWDKAFPEKPAK